LHSVLQATVEVVNFVKAHHLNTHLFTNLWEEMQTKP
jgi:hypothetical protein